LPEFVCLCVSKITQKVMEGMSGMAVMAKTTSNSILGVIRKESWILCRINMLGGGLRSPSAFLVVQHYLVSFKITHFCAMCLFIAVRSNGSDGQLVVG